MRRAIVGLALVGFAWAYTEDVGWAVAVMEFVVGLFTAAVGVVTAWAVPLFVSAFQELIAG